MQINRVIIILLFLQVVTSCKKDDLVAVEASDNTSLLSEDPTLSVEQGPLSVEQKHTASLLRSGQLKVGDPSYISRNKGDDITYDINYGYDQNKNISSEYILNNKWLITANYENQTQNCRMILVWHNAHLIQIQSIDKSIYDNPEYQPGEFIEGLEVEKYLNKK